MPVELLLMGIPTILTEDVIYALPVRGTRVWVSDSEGVEIAALIDGDFVVAFPTQPFLGDNVFFSAGSFIRCTTGNVEISIASN
jgi:hypothetical protein